jgi:hypothetical protein
MQAKLLMNLPNKCAEEYISLSSLENTGVTGTADINYYWQVSFGVNSAENEKKTFSNPWPVRKLNSTKH